VRYLVWLGFLPVLMLVAGCTESAKKNANKQIMEIVPGHRDLTGESGVDEARSVSSRVSINAHKTLLNPSSQIKFQNRLTIPAVAIADTTTFPGFEYYEMPMTQFQTGLGLRDPSTGEDLQTTVWGYAGSYPGPTIVAYSTGEGDVSESGLPVKVLWDNKLPETHILPVDTTLRCGEDAPACQPLVRTVTHLHGGHTDAGSDGHPNAWFTQGFGTGGSKFDPTLNGVYTYRNDQEAAGLWYHDHSIGVTRLNVYAGLFGLYLLRDEHEKQLIANRLLPNQQYEIPLIIQDKSFYQDGSLAYPDLPFFDPVTGLPVSLDPISGEPVPSIEPEFFGDFILVNGQIWPVLNVEPRKYRFRVLNASNSRFYEMELEYRYRDGSEIGHEDVPFYQIGTDGGLLNRVVEVDELLLAPAERVDIIVDFSDPKLSGKTIILENEAASPFPAGDPVDPASTGLIMAFRVDIPFNEAIPDSRMPRNLRKKLIPVLTATPSVPERELLLVEEEDSLGRLLPMLGTVADGPMFWGDPTTEKPVLGNTEIWSIVNATPDAHPIHQHLVQFRILDRQAFNTATFVPGQASTLRRVGLRMPPDVQEAGLKDTVQARPGEIVRIIARYDLLGDYVWHCHILEHEDHEMMRPFEVIL